MVLRGGFGSDRRVDHASGDLTSTRAVRAHSLGVRLPLSRSARPWSAVIHELNVQLGTSRITTRPRLVARGLDGRDPRVRGRGDRTSQGLVVGVLDRHFEVALDGRGARVRGRGNRTSRSCRRGVLPRHSQGTLRPGVRALSVARDRTSRRCSITPVQMRWSTLTDVSTASSSPGFSLWTGTGRTRVARRAQLPRAQWLWRACDKDVSLRQQRLRKSSPGIVHQSVRSVLKLTDGTRPSPSQRSRS
jgi:hypothetical protein